MIPGVQDSLLPVDIDLDHEREPGLQFHMHEAERFIKEIKVIVLAFACDRTEGKQSVWLFDGLEGLIVFNNREGYRSAPLKPEYL